MTDMSIPKPAQKFTIVESENQEKVKSGLNECTEKRTNEGPKNKSAFESVCAQATVRIGTHCVVEEQGSCMGLVKERERVSINEQRKKSRLTQQQATGVAIASHHCSPLHGRKRKVDKFETSRNILTLERLHLQAVNYKRSICTHLGCSLSSLFASQVSKVAEQLRPAQARGPRSTLSHTVDHSVTDSRLKDVILKLDKLQTQ